MTSVSLVDCCTPLGLYTRLSRLRCRSVHVYRTLRYLISVHVACTFLLLSLASLCSLNFHWCTYSTLLHCGGPYVPHFFTVSLHYTAWWKVFAAWLDLTYFKSHHILLINSQVTSVGCGCGLNKRPHWLGRSVSG